MGVIRLRKRFSLDEFFVFVALFCVSTYALLEHASISISVFSLIKTPIMIVGAIAIVSQIPLLARNLMRRRYFYIIMGIAALCALLLWSMYANLASKIGSSPVRGTIRLILYLVELFALMIVLAEKKAGSYALNFLYKYSIILLVINDLLMLTGVVTFRAGGFESYFLGSKFSVVYLHMNALTLWIIRIGKDGRVIISKGLVVALTVLLIIVAVRVDCMTGLIGCVLLLIMQFLMTAQNRKRFMYFISPVTLFLFFFASILFPFIAEEIVRLPFISYIIEEVFGRDVTLTGRMNIYLQYVDKVQHQWLTGYGYGNGNAVSVYLFRYENTQNALFQWILQTGIPSTGMLVFVMLQVFYFAGRAKEDILLKAQPLVALVYVYIVLGTVETTLNMSFIMWVALIFMLINETEAAPENGRDKVCYETVE